MFCVSSKGLCKQPIHNCISNGDQLSALYHDKLWPEPVFQYILVGMKVKLYYQLCTVLVALFQRNAENVAAQIIQLLMVASLKKPSVTMTQGGWFAPLFFMCHSLHLMFGSLQGQLNNTLFG